MCSTRLLFKPGEEEDDEEERTEPCFSISLYVVAVGGRRAHVHNG